MIFGKRNAKIKTLTLRVLASDVDLISEAFKHCQTSDYRTVGHYMSALHLVNELQSHAASLHPAQNFTFKFSLEDVGRLSFILDKYLSSHVLDSGDFENPKVRIAATVSGVNAEITKAVIHHLKVKDNV